MINERMDAIKLAASGRWRDILIHAGFPAECLTGKHQPCPKCGGIDRFRAFKDIDETGGVFCSKCFEKGSDGFDSVRWFLGYDFPQAKRLVADYLGLPAKGPVRPKPADPPPRCYEDMTKAWLACFGVDGQPDREWHYLDDTGQPVTAAGRWDTPDGKQMRQLSFIPGRGWTTKGAGDGRPLLNLDAVNRAVSKGRTIYVAEGETCADALRAANLDSTCNIGGSNAVKKTDWSPLRGANVVIFEDNDEPGRRFCQDVVDAIGQTCKVVRFADQTAGYDIADWVDDRDEPAFKLTDVITDELVSKAETWKPTEADLPDEEFTPRQAAINYLISNARSPEFMFEHYPKRKPEVIHGLLRQSEIMNIVSSSKAGKSFVAIDLACAIATGRSWLGFPTTQGRVLVLDNELHPEESSERLYRICDARGYDSKLANENLTIVNFRQLHEGRVIRPTIAEVEFALRGVDPGYYAMIVFDSKYRFDDIDGDANSENQQRGFYDTIDLICIRTLAAGVMVGHGTKGDQSGKDVIDMMSGSAAQGRATNTQVAFRPHESEGYTVMEARANTFKAPEPKSLVFEFPVFTVDENVTPVLKRQRNPNEATPEEDADAVERMRQAFELSEFKCSQTRVRVTLASGKMLGEQRAIRLMRGEVSAGRAVLVREDQYRPGTDPKPIFRFLGEKNPSHE